MPVPLLKDVFRPIVTDKRDLRRYVVSVTLFSWLTALSVDVVNQLCFFTSWAECLRDWLVTTAVVVAIAAPIARSMGYAHLGLHLAKREAERLGRTDPLTGLANRRALYESAAKLDGGVLALVIADIDRFKRVNDRYGHAAGDEIIRAVAARMQEELGELGVVARIGGEEFALLCADRPAAEISARLLAFRRRVASEPVVVGDHELHTTVSVGFVARSNANFDALYAAADKALYAAKTGGRDRIVDFDQMGDALAQRPPDLMRAG